MSRPVFSLLLVIVLSFSFCSQTTPESNNSDNGNGNNQTDPEDNDDISKLLEEIEDYNPIKYKKPLFRFFSYAGADDIYNKNKLSSTEFYSPILQGCYPDPAITRKGEDYYIVNSTFGYFPGVPVFHSTDLVNWKQVGHVLDRASQLNLSGVHASTGGIYAPDIKYNPYNDTFYMLTTIIGGNNGGNILVKTKDPADSWSELIKLPEVQGIDPGIYFEDAKTAYIVHNGDPDGAALYDGHRTIRMLQYDLETDKALSVSKMVINGGVHISQNPSWIEGPHLYKKNGEYYIMCAEGGTGPNHREVIFKSTGDVWGPYEPAPTNDAIILTQKHLDNSRSNPVTCLGHADIVETADGNHYGIFLGVRPAGNIWGPAVMGRETFLLPVDWTGEYPVFEGGLEALKPKLQLPAGVTNKTGTDGYMPNGNFTYVERFNSDEIDQRWFSLRESYNGFVTQTQIGGIRLTPRDNINGNSRLPASMLAFRQQHNSFTAETALLYTPETDGDLSGLTCFHSEDNKYVLGIVKRNDKYYVYLEKTTEGTTVLIKKREIELTARPVLFRVAVENADYHFYFSTDGGNDFVYMGQGTGSNLSGGFTGCVLGLYTTKEHSPVL